MTNVPAAAWMDTPGPRGLEAKVKASGRALSADCRDYGAGIKPGPLALNLPHRPAFRAVRSSVAPRVAANRGSRTGMEAGIA